MHVSTVQRMEVGGRETGRKGKGSLPRSTGICCGVDGLSVRENGRKGTEMPRGAEGNSESWEMVGFSMVGSDKR